jgi:hypothetical protein
VPVSIWDVGAGLETARGVGNVVEGQTPAAGSAWKHGGIPEAVRAPSQTEAHFQRETVSTVSRLVDNALAALKITDVTAPTAFLTAAKGVLAVETSPLADVQAVPEHPAKGPRTR